ncbi:hypothetical protein FHG87_007157 [Trinorchestia longiramus]|nr:hypothetical protein FHG87_007157 [Trinorchestia longiramus]
MAQNTDDLWDDDFDEAEVEASILKASQMCPMLLNPPVCKSNSTSRPSSSRCVAAPLAPSSAVTKKPIESFSSNTNLKIGVSNNLKNSSTTVLSNPATANCVTPTTGTAFPKNGPSIVPHHVDPLKVLDEAEKMEIDALMEDPNIWDDSTFLDDPNVFDDQSPTKSSSNSESQDGQGNSQNGKGSKLNDDQNFNKFFDSFDGIDPDLLSSQPIPGTQPRQRWQKNTNCAFSSSSKPGVTSKYPAVASSIHSKYKNLMTNGQSCNSGNATAGQSSNAVPPTKFARTSSGDRVNATIFNSMSSPTKGTLAPKQLKTYSKGYSSIGASQFFQAKHPHVSSAQKPSVSTSSIKTIQKPVFARRNSENLPSSKACPSQADIFTKFPGATQGPSQFVLANMGADMYKINQANEDTEALQQKLASSEETIAQLQKEIMTKKGEVSCLRSELQRKTMTLDAERMARMGAADKHKKEISEKVAAAALEAQSKSRALEKRLEKLHSDMAFKSREIIELTTKCKRLEQGQMQQQKRHQQQLQIYSQIVNSQEKQPPASEQFQSPPRFLSPPPPPSPSLSSKNPLNESRRFPRSRFDFSKDGPSAGTQSLQLASPKSSVTNITKAPPSLPKPQIPPASPTTVEQKFSDDNAGEDELSVLNDVHLASMFRKKGFYKASSESLSMLGDLSSTRRISASESTEDVLAYDTRHQLARHLLASCPRNESVVFSEHFNLAYTSVVEVDRSENLDSLCERDEENNYTDEIVGGDFKAVEIKPMVVKREKLLKKSLGNVASKVLENETKDIVVNFDNITQERASYRDLYCSTVAYMKELEIGQVCEAECPVVHQWNDKILHPMNLSSNKDAASSRSNKTQKKRSSWSVQRTLKAHDRTTNNINDLEKNKSSVLDVNTIPQEWARLLSAMSQDSSNRKFENPLEEDILDEEMNAVCDSDTAETENNFIGFNSSDILKVSTSTAFLQRKRSAMMEKLGNFLYDLTQEMLEDNIRDLTSSQSRKEVKTSVNGERSSKSGEGANWVSDRSTKTVKVEKNSEYTSIPKENFDALLLALGSPSKSAKNYTEQMNASRELFHCVLEWLAEEAAYYRNVEKKLLPKRSDNTSEQHMKVMSSALIILQHLLPLRFSCQHLPPPMTVLAFLLYPLDTTTSMVNGTRFLVLRDSCLSRVQ